ncbi:hypothetical protein SISSUDRAFT_1053135 [Sistotremastrum suecicum HHB10207 ss-3]|uniref:Hydrophobin n=1 Tax=Sistotremastrum suecicum HHB10207 ss-3 TaxID=1314776 RepID=A0A165ZE46_9AGAM|nr:hypothetical protein SISSUDRAFT_1053135 [Sistotremastrum suecicum HHB10207 ss-3]
MFVRPHFFSSFMVLLSAALACTFVYAGALPDSRSVVEHDMVVRDNICSDFGVSLNRMLTSIGTFPLWALSFSFDKSPELMIYVDC